LSGSELKPGGLTIAADRPLGTVRIHGHGFWSPSIVDEHFEELRQFLTPYRQSALCVRMIVDLRSASVQSVQTTERLTVGVCSVTMEGDRIGILVSSSLAKGQMRRVIGSSSHQFFLSPDAARKWVEAYDC
jgi:hypothetical protein